MGEIILEMYEMLFIASIVYLVFILGNFIIKFYGRIKLMHSTRIVLSTSEKIIMWLSITILFSYIF